MVQEIERASFECLLTNILAIVLLPAPEGAERTMSFGAVVSTNISELFLEFLEVEFDFDGMIRNSRILNFISQCRDFSKKFLL